MKIRDLKHVKDCPNNFDLENEQRFIHWYGQCNCKVLKAKEANQILSIMREQMPTEEFSIEQVNFMNEISGKEVLVYLCRSFEDRPDIFVYPENNTPFSVERFV